MPVNPGKVFLEQRCRWSTAPWNTGKGFEVSLKTSKISSFCNWKNRHGWFWVVSNSGGRIDRSELPAGLGFSPFLAGKSPQKPDESVVARPRCNGRKGVSL